MRLRRFSSLNEVRGQPQAASCGRQQRSRSGKGGRGYALLGCSALAACGGAQNYVMLAAFLKCGSDSEATLSSLLIGLRCFLSSFKLDITHTPRATPLRRTRTDTRDVSLHNQESLRSSSALASLALSGAWEATQLALSTAR